MAKMKLTKLACPECGSDSIAIDFEALDRRFVLGIDADGDPVLDDRRFETIECDTQPQEYWCIGCGHSWPLDDHAKYDFAASSDVEVEAYDLAAPGEGDHVIVVTPEDDRLTYCQPCAVADGYDPDTWLFRTNAPCHLCERDTPR